VLNYFLHRYTPPATPLKADPAVLRLRERGPRRRRSCANDLMAMVLDALRRRPVLDVALAGFDNAGGIVGAYDLTTVVRCPSMVAEAMTILRRRCRRAAPPADPPGRARQASPGARQP
jgi:hypothetical protein